jgi:hypothetical protein
MRSEGLYYGHQLAGNCGYCFGDVDDVCVPRAPWLHGIRGTDCVKAKALCALFGVFLADIRVFGHSSFALGRHPKPRPAKRDPLGSRRATSPLTGFSLNLRRGIEYDELPKSLFLARGPCLRVVYFFPNLSPGHEELLLNHSMHLERLRPASRGVVAICKSDKPEHHQDGSD